ncbi:MAG TPA: sulfatase [bacterium]|nr:sulfatase [bacterium]HPN42163.1 sulfatase [bacterium]
MGKKQSTSRRHFIGTMGALAAALPLAQVKAETIKQPARIKGIKPRNIIIILADDHRYDFMSFIGKPAFLKTPNMDRMASEGAWFEKAFVTTALCSPSRASLLTGQFSHKHGVVDNNTMIPENTVFFPQYLQQAGYQTAFIGKWHMGDDSDAPRKGFDKWISFRGQGDYYDPTLNIDGKTVQTTGYITDMLTDYALDWLQKERDQQKPYFLYLSHKAVHAMFEPAKRHLGVYENEIPEYPASMADTPENYAGKPRWVKEQRNSWHGVDYMYHGDMDYDTFYKRYCETLLAVDESIGKILDYLQSCNELENTVVMYMGDNGFMFGEHGLIDKRSMYEESMRVPFLAYCPELIKPQRVSGLVQNIDIAPTLLELAGLETPANMDGKLLMPLLQNVATTWRSEIFYEYYWERNFPHTPTVHGVRTDKHKYIHYHGIWDCDELYDLENDPQEMHNLINEPQYQDLVKSLNQKLFDWLETSKGMMIPLRRDKGFRADRRKPG